VIDLADITPELIACICRQDTLLDWHDAAYERYDEVKVQYNLNRFTDELTPAWENRAKGDLAQMEMLMRRIGRRLAAIGYDVPITRRSKRNNMFRALESKLCEVNRENRALRAQLRNLAT